MKRIHFSRDKREGINKTGFLTLTCIQGLKDDSFYKRHREIEVNLPEWQNKI